MIIKLEPKYYLYFHKKYILYDIIAPYDNPLRLLYRLDNSFSVFLQPYNSKTNPVKNNLKNSSKIGELVFASNWRNNYLKNI